jgi:hypothetical protein
MVDHHSSITAYRQASRCAESLTRPAFNLCTVRTIIGRKTGTDRSTKERRQRIENRTVRNLGETEPFGIWMSLSRDGRPRQPKTERIANSGPANLPCFFVEPSLAHLEPQG